MQVSDDVMELVQLLNEEGFGHLAGELLTEISLGREIEDPDGDDADGSRPENTVLREPIPEDEQLDVALKLLEWQLVEPVRHLAEAETIAGRLAASPELEEGIPDVVGYQTAVEPYSGIEPIQIVFRPPPDRSGEVLQRTEASGSARWADALSKALRRLSIGAI